VDLSTLQSTLARLAGARVLVVGDVMIDRFVYGDVTRVSAEAPIPVLAHAQESAMLGGAGNVARNIASLGGCARLVGLIGNDTAGAEIEGLLAAAPGIEGALVPDRYRTTTVKMRFVAAGQQLLRVDTETLAACAGAAEAALIAALDHAQDETHARAVLVSDYGKGVVTPAVIQAALAAARRCRAILVVDSKARGFAHYGAVDVVKPNALELSRATGLSTETDAEIETALAAALHSCQAGAILVTRAAKGMSLAVRGAPVRHFSRPAPEVFDTAGAGDTVLAVLGVALAAGARLDDAVELALIASHVVVRKAGVAVATPDEVLEDELAAHRSPLEHKIATPERMSAEAERWRARGLRVGFTNGCFDILHPGHIAYLSQAKSWCDRLIVGLNSDASIRALKGPGRPVNPLEARALVLAALSVVDLVASFDEPTPIELIKAARPDLLVKGADYSLDGVVGRSEVESWGGEVRLAAFVEGHSTTSTLQRMSTPS
jgi:D-beta-D-heptose 7-phosphate kinase/D-beta-D-heptose 1-phosphate adenosyltransferase